MPTYVYKCVQCENVFEVFKKKVTRARARQCPECGGRAERQISAGAGFLFKGSGFYATDYRSDEYRSKASADTETGPDKSEKQEKKKTKTKPKGGDKNAST